MNRFFLSIMAVPILSTCASADVILTGGGILQSSDPFPGNLSVDLIGANLSIFSTSFVPLTLLPQPAVNGLTSTWTYNFTESFNHTVLPGNANLQVTYNGINYGTIGSLSTNGTLYSIQLIMSFSGGVATAVSNPPCNSGNCALADSNVVPFTLVSGSFSVSQGGNTIVSDTFSGAGTGSFFAGQDNGNPGGGTNQVRYDFSSTPEPASMGLVASGLLLTGWFARRRRVA